MKFSAENPQLHKAANRYQQGEEKTTTLKMTDKMV